MSKTPCECPQPGWCERHQCAKSPFFHYQCRNVPARFAEWEQVREEPSHETPSDGIVEPGLLRKGVNYGVALLRHLAAGAKQVAPELREERLLICRACPQCDLSRMVCRHAQCGCDLSIKARWETSVCPLGQWPVK